MLGIVTERDLLHRVLAAGKDPDATRIREVMSTPVKTCRSSDGAASCGDVMAAEHIRHLVVMDEKELMGVISLRDVQMATQTLS